MINCKDITFQYPDGPSFSFPDLHCADREKLMIIGESGKGKTTLLHIMAGILSPTGGSVQIGGTEISKMHGSALDLFRGKNIGIVFQTAHFMAALNVLDNLLMPGFLTKNPVQKEVGMEILERLNIGHKALANTENLSIGEKQRLSIARALIGKPSLVLADEPTSALDDKNAFEVIDLLEEQAELTGSSLVIVTHDNRLKSHFNNAIEL